MSLLNVAVKRAKYVGPQAAQLNTYVTLKLQNVKSTTVTVKGSEPCWEQDFLFETNNVNSGLLVEVWTKGMIWDRALGYQLIPLDTIPYNTESSQGQWYPLDMDIILMDGEVAGTKNPTGYSILLDCRFELPFDPETQPGELQRKLEMLNAIMTRNDRKQRQEQYHGNSGYSEDSDYTSDLNYPIGLNANSSASQYRNLQTPDKSFETSRDNSYEKDDKSIYYDCYSELPRQNMTSYTPTDYYYKDENDPLFYNSRPMSSMNYNKTNNSNIISYDDHHNTSHMNPSHHQNNSHSIMRKRSLERQETLFDEYGDPYVSSSTLINNDNYQNNYETDQHGFYDMNSDNLSEDRQWDSGGRGTSMNKILPRIPMKQSSSMIDGIYHRGASLPPTPPVAHKKTRLLPQPATNLGSGGCDSSIGSGKSLPSTPRMLPRPKQQQNIFGKKLPSTPAASLMKQTQQQPYQYQKYDTTEYNSSNYNYYDSQQKQDDRKGSNLISNLTYNMSSPLPSITSYNIRPYTSVSGVNNTYNEDYNYAYHSSDSLNTFSDVISRRKGAALPAIPSSSITVPKTSAISVTIMNTSSTTKSSSSTLSSLLSSSALIGSLKRHPKVGQANQNSNYNSSSFEYAKTTSDTTSNDYYSNMTTNDDYFYDSNLLNNELNIYSSIATESTIEDTDTYSDNQLPMRKSKKLSMPITCTSSATSVIMTTTTTTTTSSLLSSGYSSALNSISDGLSRINSKLPVIPKISTSITATTAAASATTIPGTTSNSIAVTTSSYSYLSSLYGESDNFNDYTTAITHINKGEYSTTPISTVGTKMTTVSSTANDITNYNETTYDNNSYLNNDDENDYDADLGSSSCQNDYYDDYISSTIPTCTGPTFTTSASIDNKLNDASLPSYSYDSNDYYSDYYNKSYLDDNNKDTIVDSTITTFEATTNNDYSTTIIDYTTSSYINDNCSNSLLTSSAITNDSALSCIGTTTTSSKPLGGYYRPASAASTVITNTDNVITGTIGSSGSTLKSSTTSVLGSLTTGLKATVGGVVGSGTNQSNNTSNSSVTGSNTSQTGSSLTSTAKSYLGLASKFLPNLTGGSSSSSHNSNNSANTSLNSTQTTSSGTASTITSSLSLNFMNKFSSNISNTIISDSNDVNNQQQQQQQYNNSLKQSTTNNVIYSSYNNTISSDVGNNSLYSNNIVDTLNQDRANYNNCYVNNYSNDNKDLDNYNIDSKFNQQYLDNIDYEYNNDYDNMSIMNSVNKLSTTTITADSTTTTTATTISSSSIELNTTNSSLAKTARMGNIVDYSDYKYGYDEYSYSENDYIATGDITDKQNYNNNYDIYDTGSHSTGKIDDVENNTTNSSIDIKTGATSISSSSVYDCDYNNVGYLLNNKNLAYCDTSSKLIISSSSSSSPSQSSSASTTTITTTTTMIPPLPISSSSLGVIGGNTIISTSSTLTQNKTGASSLINNSGNISNYTDNYINNIYDNSITSATSTGITATKLSSTSVITSSASILNDNNSGSGYSSYMHGITKSGDIMSSSSAGTDGTKKLPLIQNNNKNNYLIKQQTEIYDEDDQLCIDDTDHIDEEDDYYMDGGGGGGGSGGGGISGNNSHMQPSNDEQQLINSYYGTGNNNAYLNSNIASYYDYREDYFDEEDEYKYLEDEEQEEKQMKQKQHNQQQQQKSQLLNEHQKQPPLEFIEESHDDYLNDEHIPDHAIDNAYLDSSQQINKQIADNKIMKHHQHQLSAQETIDDIDDDLLIDHHQQQQQHQNLKKQDSIIEEEEDEDQIPSSLTGDNYHKDDDDIQMSSLTAAVTTGGGLTTALTTIVPSTAISSSLDNQMVTDIRIDEIPKKKSITRGETEEVTSGQVVVRKPTARERWTMAYNKIIMELNALL